MPIVQSPSLEYITRPIGATSILSSQRYLELDWKGLYGVAKQHDYKTFDFDGRVINAGPRQMQPFLGESSAVNFVSLKQRRPCAPMHLGKLIVKTFTNFLFGEDHFPTLTVPGDKKAQNFYSAIVKACGMRSKMMLARDNGGSCGTAVISWCWQKGKPRVQVHNAKNVFVHVWEDRDELIPEWASEIYRFQRDEWNASDQKYYRKHYWYRRDWTPEYDVLFPEIPVEHVDGRLREPNWFQYASKAETIAHGDGRSHIVWIQNVPCDDIDGFPDYDGQYDALDSIDITNSLLTRSTTLNMDPTLLLHLDPDMIKAGGVKKGSDNAMVVGTDGNASYLEMSGSGTTAGLSVLQQQRRNILESCQCVVPDPDQISANGTSSVAMKILYRPTIAYAQTLREQYGERGLVRVVDGLADVARKYAKETAQVPSDLEEQDESEDASKEAPDEPAKSLDELPKTPWVLPPVVSTEHVIAGDGTPTGDERVTREPQDPGEGGEIVLDWGNWFPFTPQDKQALVNTVSMATGGKACLSKQSGSEEIAAAFSRNPASEWMRMNEDHETDQKAEEARNDAFGGAGGGMGDPSFGSPPAPANPFKKPFGGSPFGKPPNQPPTGFPK
jgi:hypothetical protein